jgi:hypothetical protein
METHGDLKKTIKNVLAKKKAERVGKAALGAVISAVPGLGTAKDGLDVVKSLFNRPDTKKTNTWLDKLDVDDEASAIVDDTVEDTFIQDKYKNLMGEPDEKPLDQNFSMNKELVQFLKDKYKNRTLFGIKENTMKVSEFKHIIKQEIIAEQEKTGEVSKVQNLTPLLKKLELDPTDEKNFKKAALQGTRNLNIDKSVATVFLKLLSTDNKALLGIFNALKQVKAKG